MITPGKKAQEEVGTSKGASSSGQENPGQTGVEPEQGEYWQYSQEEWEQWDKREASLSQDATANGGIRRRLVSPKAPPGKREREALKRKGGAFKSMEASETGRSAAVTAAASSPPGSESKNLGRGAAKRGKA